MHRRILGHEKRLAAIGFIAVLFWFTRLPNITNEERVELASRFRFNSQPLPEVTGREVRTVRPVHPSLDHISAWISSVGAAVALGDLDGDALPNDVCYVDTRTDQVIVGPVPGTGARYAPFTLEPGDHLFDRKTMAPMGCVPGDLNEDGLTDVLVYFWGRTPIAFLRRQQADGSSSGTSNSDLGAGEFAACEIASPSERWFTNAATRADVDGDGHVDIIIGNYFLDGARVLDTDADGQEAMQDSMSRAFNGGRNRILLWRGSTSGVDPTIEYHEATDVLDVDGSPVAVGWTLAIGAVDLDGDQLPEIYFANDFGPDRFLHNRSQPSRPRFALLEGRRSLTTPASKVLGRDSFKGMGVDFADVNADGHMDIYVSNIAAEYALEESHFLFTSTGRPDLMQQGIAPYVDSGESLGVSRSGWGWESRLADFDNDGVPEAVQATGFVKGEKNRWPELHEAAMGNDQLLSSPVAWHRIQPGDDLSGDDHNPFFVRSADGRFYDVAAELGIDQPQVTRGIAVADVDADGDLDFAIGNQWVTSYFYQNDSRESGAFLGLRLLLPLAGQHVSGPLVVAEHPSPAVKGTAAIGASATVHLASGRKLIGQVDGGNGHSGVRSSELHFGLGDLPQTGRLRIDLAWRNRAGRLRRETLQLTPGWHTVLLGSPVDEVKSAGATNCSP